MSARQAANGRSECTRSLPVITLMCPKEALKGAYPLAVDIAHNMLNRLYIRPPDTDPN